MKYLIGYVFIGLLIAGLIMPIIRKSVEGLNPETKQRRDFLMFGVILLMAAVWPVAVGAMIRRVFAKRS